MISFAISLLILNVSHSAEQTVIVTPQTKNCRFTETFDNDCIAEKKGNYGVLNHIRRLNTAHVEGVSLELYTISYFTAISCDDAKSRAKFSSYSSLKSAYDALIHDYREYQKDEAQNFPSPPYKGGLDWHEQIEEKLKPKPKFELTITYDDATGEVIRFNRNENN